MLKVKKYKIRNKEFNRLYSRPDTKEVLVNLNIDKIEVAN